MDTLRKWLEARNLGVLSAALEEAEIDLDILNELTDEEQKREFDQRVAKDNGGLIGATMVSDAFFPFRDGLDVGIREGISAVIQPGGSLNDYQSIEACNEADVTMVYTGQRSFKH